MTNSKRDTSPTRRPEHLVCTRPKPAACKHCRGYILICLSYGEAVELEPVHVSAKGEAVALVSGLQTFTAGDTRDGVARLRSVQMIQAGLPSGGWVHPAHRCGMKYEGDCLDTRNLWSTPAYYLGAVPPF